MLLPEPKTLYLYLLYKHWSASLLPVFFFIVGAMSALQQAPLSRVTRHELPKSGCLRELHVDVGGPGRNSHVDVSGGDGTLGTLGTGTG